MEGGSDASSRYIVYSLVPGGVFRRQGSSFVPLPFAIPRLLVPYRAGYGSAGGRTGNDGTAPSDAVVFGLRQRAPTGSIFSTKSARHAGASNGLAKYSVIFRS